MFGLSLSTSAENFIFAFVLGIIITVIALFFYGQYLTRKQKANNQIVVMHNGRRKTRYERMLDRNRTINPK